jgi:type I restriction enzyme, R subunit
MTSTPRGNDFCAKITHKARRPQELLAAFRNTAQLRIAVTVDMIATGTDVKALECLIFMRDVRSWAYFEQMKGRGARTLSQTEFQSVTPDLLEKTRFVIVDAVGVTENPKVDAAPLDRDPTQRQSLEKLLRKVAAGECNSDDVSTLGSRLARLNRDLENRPQEKQELERLASLPLHRLARGLIDAVSIDAQETARLKGGETAVGALLDQALDPLARNPELRRRILEIRRAVDILYDTYNTDRLLEAGPIANVSEATSVVTSWRAYLSENRTEITDWYAAYAQRSLKPRELFTQLKEIAERMKRPPRRWTPDLLWQAYDRVGIVGADGAARHGVSDLVTVIRFELGIDSNLRSYASVVEERFRDWLNRQEQAGERFTASQLWWLEHVAQATAMTVRFDTADLDHVPFSSRGGTDGFLAAFGDDRAVSILDELDQDLTA